MLTRGDLGVPTRNAYLQPLTLASRPSRFILPARSAMRRRQSRALFAPMLDTPAPPQPQPYVRYLLVGRQPRRRTGHRMSWSGATVWWRHRGKKAGLGAVKKENGLQNNNPFYPMPILVLSIPDVRSPSGDARHQPPDQRRW